MHGFNSKKCNHQAGSSFPNTHIPIPTDIKEIVSLAEVRPHLIVAPQKAAFIMLFFLPTIAIKAAQFGCF